MVQTAAVRMPAMITGAPAAARPAAALARRHADAVGGLVDRRIDADDAGHAVPQDRQHGVERQRQQRRQEAERREAVAEQPLRDSAESASSSG